MSATEKCVYNRHDDCRDRSCTCYCHPTPDQKVAKARDDLHRFERRVWSGMLVTIGALAGSTVTSLLFVLFGP